MYEAESTNNVKSSMSNINKIISFQVIYDHNSY